MKEYFVKYLSYPLQDMYKGTKILNTYEILLESQFWDSKKLENYRTEKMIDLVNYAYRNVPFYKNKYDEYGINIKSIQNFSDFETLPVITKDEVRKNNVSFFTKNYAKIRHKKGKTGGTTGPPVIVLKDTQNRSFTWGSYYRWLNWIGVKYYDPITTLWGVSITKTSFVDALYNIIKNQIQNKQVVNTFNLNKSTFSKIYDEINKNKPKMVKGYLSSLISLADLMNQHNVKFKNHLTAVSSTTETLLPHHRTYLENTFDSKIYDQYGCGEVSAIAYECNYQNGLHINQEHVHVEILDDNNNRILNNTGRVIATDLDNKIMPFIRFETGDSSILSDKTCECSVNQPLLKRIEGRSADTIILNNGSKVHGVFFTIVLYELGILANEIPKFQVYQKYPGEIEFRIEAFRRLPTSKKQEIESVLLNHLNKVEIVEYDELPYDKSGKFRYVVSEIASTAPLK